MNQRTFLALVIAFATQPALGNTFEQFYQGEQSEFFATVNQLGPTTSIDFVGIPKGTVIDTQYDEFGVEFGPFVTISETPSALDGFAIRGSPIIELTFSDPQYWFAIDFLGAAYAQFHWEDELIAEVAFEIIFGGIVMDKPFDRVVLYDPSDEVVAIDNIYFGAPLTVPAPGALTILLAGAFSTRGRQRLR